MNTDPVDDIEAVVNAADERWADDSLTRPTAASWGFYSYGDAPAAIGGGMGSFCWFGSRAKMLRFVVDVLPYSPPGPSDSDCTVVARQVTAIISEIESEKIDLEKARRKLNRVLRSYSQIEWIGTFKELASGQKAYSKRIIKAFRHAHDLPINSAPIEVTRAQMAEFKIFLSEFGI